VRSSNTINSSGQTVGVKAVWKVCGKCDECVAGEDALCSDALSSGAHKNGTFQEYSIGPASYVTPVPEGIDPRIAAPLMVLSVLRY
jgi:propanol-preferring alcohol dehydrogenase